MATTPPSETQNPQPTPPFKTLLQGGLLGFFLALLVGGGFYWWANLPVPATMTLETPAPAPTRIATPETPNAAPATVDTPTLSRSLGMQVAVDALVNLNSATLAELETLPGIGPARAQAIIDGRPYATIDDLDHVPGIGPATIANLRALVSVD